jgi:pyruvate dehydrogenase E2 component (dihydrolipoamide acetyltransferase)
VTEDEIVYKRTYNIGFSVDAPGGLVVPVVHDADRHDLRSLAGLIGELTGAARDRSLSREALSGLTFTVSNVGAVGGGFGTPLIPYGTTAILSVGRAREEPVVRNHQIEVGLRMPVSLSYDHRVIDGGTGRRFITMLSELLQDPKLFLGAS